MAQAAVSRIVPVKEILDEYRKSDSHEQNSKRVVIAMVPGHG